MRVSENSPAGGALFPVAADRTLLPHPELFEGSPGTSDILHKHGSASSLLHIATHGSCYQGNPMFSGIRPGDGYLNLNDLYKIRLPAKLVTLSGCAGAKSLLLSLWDVHDESTSELMREFYAHYIQTGDIPGAVQSAMKELRQQHPHP
jgi:CHAT domain-containing protein